jgi:hypothetical protein
MLGQMFCFKVSSPFTSSSLLPHLRDTECVLYPTNDLFATKDHIGLAKYVYKKNMFFLRNFTNLVKKFNRSKSNKNMVYVVKRKETMLHITHDPMISTRAPTKWWVQSNGE